MTRQAFISALFAVVPTLGIAGGCGSSSDDDDSAIACPFDYTTYTPASDPSFKDDVVPLLQRACNLRTCHGGGFENSRADLYTGLSLSSGPPEQSELDQIHAMMLLAPSTTTNNMPRVTPGDPANSFLMVKIDGCQNFRGLTCTAQSGAVSDGVCGDDMPQSQPALPDSEKNVFRDWIAMGAKNN